MSERQLHKWRIMGLVDVGKITLKEAGEEIGVSYRQAKRLWKVPDGRTRSEDSAE